MKNFCGGVQFSKLASHQLLTLVKHDFLTCTFKEFGLWSIIRNTFECLLENIFGFFQCHKEFVHLFLKTGTVTVGRGWRGPNIYTHWSISEQFTIYHHSSQKKWYFSTIALALLDIFFSFLSPCHNIYNTILCNKIQTLQ